MPDDREFMTVGEFAGMSSNDQHAVWRARSEGRVEAILASPGSASGPLRYHRVQVQELLLATATAALAEEAGTS